MSITQSTLIDDTAVLNRICELIRQWCGVTLDSAKHYMVRNRLRPVQTDFNISSLEELVAKATGPTGIRLRERVIDALTTHETLFFRDQTPFDALKTHIIPEARKAAGNGRPRLRVWSSACSTGQEPYSVAMWLLESIPDIAGWEIKILASDVSVMAVEQARIGRYQEHELRRGLSPELRLKYFDKVGEDWQIQDRVRRLVQFQPGNLLGASQPPGPFELIYCRNVAIYFSDDDRKKVFQMTANRLAPGGRLFVGCSEVLSDFRNTLKMERVGNATCYSPV